jgi:heme/copper-type cytochrome/quinol oxidase subunit 2
LEGCVSRTVDVDEVDRRRFLKYLAWFGAASVWTMSSGRLTSSGMKPLLPAARVAGGEGGLPVHEVRVVANKFAFEPAVIEVTAGEHVRLVIQSADTVHGFSIPALRLDVHVPRRSEVTVEFDAPPVGRFDIKCSEFCGAGHGRMRGTLVSVAPRDGR